MNQLLEDLPHALYRFFGHSGELVYVGISARLPSRLTKHRGGKSWWCDVAIIELEHFPSRQAALDAEQRAIIAEKPVANIQHNRPNARPAAPAAPKAWWWPDPNSSSRQRRPYPWPGEKKRKPRKKGRASIKSNEPEIQCTRCWHGRRAYGPDAKCKPCRTRLDAGAIA